MADRELIRDYYTSMYGHCEGCVGTDPRTLTDTGKDARLDGVRSYTAQTFRAPLGIYQFVQVVTGNEVVRICLPPAIVKVLEQQRESVALKVRQAHGRAAAKRLPRPPKGIVPPQFAARRRGKRK